MSKNEERNKRKEVPQVEFLNYLISGISLGSVYAIIALGYTMVYGIAKMLNFAHGDVIMVGGYVSFCAMQLSGPARLAGHHVLAMVVCTVLGVVIEGLAYKPLREAGSLAVLITAIGVSYFLQNAAQLIWTAAPKVYTPVVSGQPERGRAVHPLCVPADHRGVHHHHGGPDHLYQQEQDGQGHAGLLRG